MIGRAGGNMEKSHIEVEFQSWLQKVNEGFAYVLCAPECAARHAFEAGYNTARQEYLESARTDKQQLKECQPQSGPASV